MKDNNKYSVYVHKVDTAYNGPMWYVGITQNVKNRWMQSNYKNNSLWPYIQKYGWNNIEHRVIADGLDRDTALKLEDCLILMYRSADSCINQKRSGLIETNGITEYRKQYSRDNIKKLCQWRKDHKEEQKLKTKQMLSTPAGKIYNRVNGFNWHHPDRAIETPLEARDKYLATGYIPQYIKHDDLQ